MKLKATVFGKKDCSLCDNRKENIRRFPALCKKQLDKEVEVDLIYHDIKTVEGLVAYCQETRSVSDIPIVILEDEKGQLLKIWNGPTDPVKPRDILDILATK